MINRGVEIAGFLVQHKWDDAQQTAFDADFSPRRYARLTKADGKRAILMDADADQKTPQFVAIAKLLKQLDLSAPAILAADPRAGLVLLEDLGDQNMGHCVDAGGDLGLFVRRAVDVLVHLHQSFRIEEATTLDVPLFDKDLFADQASLYLDAYVPLQRDHPVLPEEREAFQNAWRQSLACLADLPTSLLLRDYMLDNLMDLPERDAYRSVGILDFQDAGLGSVAYDLASLAEVVRRDGKPGMLEDILKLYYQQMQPAYSLEALTRVAIVLSAQRHTRVLGIVVRLAHKGQTGKLAYLPRIRQHLAERLEHPALQPVADWFNRYSPLYEQDL